MNLSILAGILANIRAIDARMFASNRTEFPSGAGQPTTAGTLWQVDAVSFVMPNYDQNTPIFAWPGFYVFGTTNEVACANDVPIRNAYLEVNGTVVGQLKFSGNAGGTIPAGGYLLNDPDPTLLLPANATVRVRTQTLLTNGQFRLGTYLPQPFDGHQQSGVSNLDAYCNGTTNLPSPSVSTAALVGPCVFTALGWSASSKPPVPLILGDSIGYRQNDTNGLIATEGVFGYVNRAMIDTTGAGRFCYGNFCGPGTKLEGLDVSPFAQRRAILTALGNPFTSVYVQMGINTTAASRVSIWESTAGPYVQGLAGTKRIIGGTLIPQVTIVNGTRGTVLADMTANDNSLWNNYLKGNTKLYFNAYVDNTPAFESSPGSGKPPVPGFSTTLAADFVSGTNTVSLVAAPTVQMSLVMAPGGSSLPEKSVLSVTGTGPYTVTFPFTFTGTFPAGTVMAASNTEEGTHPLTLLSIAGKAPLVAAKAAGNIFT